MQRSLLIMSRTINLQKTNLMIGGHLSVITSVLYLRTGRHLISFQIQIIILQSTSHVLTCTAAHYVVVIQTLSIRKINCICAVMKTGSRCSTPTAFRLTDTISTVAHDRTRVSTRWRCLIPFKIMKILLSHSAIQPPVNNWIYSLMRTWIPHANVLCSSVIWTEH